MSLEVHMAKSVDLHKDVASLTPTTLITADADTSRLSTKVLHTSATPNPDHFYHLANFYKALQRKCYMEPFMGKTFRWIYIHEPEWWYHRLMKNKYFCMTVTGQILSKLI